MPYHEIHYSWKIQLASTPEELWPLVSDTNRFDHDAGVPPLERIHGNPQTSGNARQNLRLKLFGIKIEWEEQPFEWIRPWKFGVQRIYRQGPLAELRMLAEFPPNLEGGTSLSYQVWVRPRNFLGRILAPLQVGLISRLRFASTFKQYDHLARTGKKFIAQLKPIQSKPSESQRITNLQQQLLAQGTKKEILDHLIDFIRTADDLSLAKIRPYQLADEWKISRKETLITCLQATRAGLLEFRWDILCPLCRGAKQTQKSLNELKSQVHCDVCQIDFAGTFDRNIEVSFRPTPAVRRVEVSEYCVGGPQTTPHIVVQQLLSPSSERLLEVPFEEGHYRIRTLKLKGNADFCICPNGKSSGTWIASKGGWPSEEVRLNLRPSLLLKNQTSEEQLFILEKTGWIDQAATARDVTVLQIFRDLFANEALRPGEQISVGNVTIMFTDLSNSTQLYRKIGDAPAFGYVMNHFDVLKKTISEEGGSIVKTIGDAVMAVFSTPLEAVRAILKAQKELSALASYDGVLLRASIHHGPCIAVNSNDRLDYFGSNINIAARLVNLSSGKDIIISDTVKNDPESLAWIQRQKGHSLTLEPMKSALKGFENEHFELWKVASIN